MQSTMILYLLVPVFVLGVMESQTANTTITTWTEMHKMDWNQTVNMPTLVNNTIKPSNVTSDLFKQEEKEIEDLLKGNETSVLTEDNEGFQDQEEKLQNSHCLQQNMTMSSKTLCVDAFHLAMQEISQESWCVMDNIIGHYHEMTRCIELVSVYFNCFYPSQASQDIFVRIHSTYFTNCSQEEVVMEDAPQGLVIALTLLPVSLIPLLTYLVVIKGKVQE